MADTIAEAYEYVKAIVELYSEAFLIRMKLIRVHGNLKPHEIGGSYRTQKLLVQD